MDVTSVHAPEHSLYSPQDHTVQTSTSTRTLKFQNSDEANNWLHSVTMLPPINPQADPTIDIIAANRQTWVLAMIDATYDLTSCADNPKMLAHFQASSPSFISELEVEAACHILFDILIAYCRYGFRGLPKTNVHVIRSSSGKKNFPEDKAADCLTRMGNVIMALRSWKSVCKGVVEEDTKKWQLVNAPFGVVGKKESERRCNVTKKKVADEGKKAKNELVKTKAAAVSHRPGADTAGYQQPKTGGGGPHTAHAATTKLPTPQNYGIDRADVAGMWIQEHPQHANAAKLQAPAPQIVSPSNYHHTPDGFVSVHQGPHPQVYGLSPVSHQHNWPRSDFYWPQGGLQGETVQPLQPLNVDDHDEQFWQGLGKFEYAGYAHDYHVQQPTSLDVLAQAAVHFHEVAPQIAGQYQTPAPAVSYAGHAPVADDTELSASAGSDEALCGSAEVSLTSNDVVREVADHLVQPPQAISRQHGVKRGRETSDTDVDAPGARRLKLDENVTV